MKLLVTTQSVDLDNSVLAFFHAWLGEFAKHCEKVTVICLEKGRYNLPPNVQVISLGKALHSGKSNFISKIKYLINFYRNILVRRQDYDAVFVHMNPIYIVLGGLVWKIWGKNISLWYTHKHVDPKLRLAEKFVDEIFTASAESFRLPSKKINIVGHGIEIDLFSSTRRTKQIFSEPIKIIHVGRITAIKNCHVLIEAARLLKQKLNKKFAVVFAGKTVTSEDEVYSESLRTLISESELGEEISFVGEISREKLPNFYASADIAVNLTPTGGMDKAVLEAMAAGTIVLSSNKTFGEYFGQYRDVLIFEEKNSEDLANKILNLIQRGFDDVMTAKLKQTAMEKASVSDVIEKIIKKMS